MIYEFMRLVLFFDLPMKTKKEIKIYTHFRKYLIKNSFLMMQESIYCKLAQNSTAADLIIQNIRKNKPPSGLVQTLKITEKQFSRIEYIVGKKESEVLDSDERIVIL